MPRGCKAPCLLWAPAAKLCRAPRMVLRRCADLGDSNRRRSFRRSGRHRLRAPPRPGGQEEGGLAPWRIGRCPNSRVSRSEASARCASCRSGFGDSKCRSIIQVRRRLRTGKDQDHGQGSTKPSWAWRRQQCRSTALAHPQRTACSLGDCSPRWRRRSMASRGRMLSLHLLLPSSVSAENLSRSLWVRRTRAQLPVAAAVLCCASRSHSG
mmetsp:Transcript_70873/g.159154  ORF Transcript_70873/g.159154 Transcript_70873/m.159154 type:complete len:210 (-) Transcript_70873:570-1199(-)